MPRPRARNKWSDPDELKSEVHRQCKESVLNEFAVTWDDDWGRELRRDYTRETELDQRARAHIEEIEKVVAAAERFLCDAGLEPRTRPSSEKLEPLPQPWVPHAVESLRDWFEERFHGPYGYEPLPKSFRGYLIERWRMAANGDRPLPGQLGKTVRHHLPTLPEEFVSLPSHHEFALISLLCGEFPPIPSKPKMTVSKLVDDEANNMRKARVHVLGSERADIAIAPEHSLYIEAFERPPGRIAKARPPEKA